MTSTNTPLTTDSPNYDQSIASMTGFFSNKGAMAAVFTCAGILLLILGALIHMAWNRKRRLRQRRHQESSIPSRRISMRSASHAFSTFDTQTPPPITRPLPSLHFSFGSISDRLWNGQKRRSGTFSPSPHASLLRMERYGEKKRPGSEESFIGSAEIMLYRPSGEESELGHIYGRVRGIDTPPPPPPPPPPSSQSPPWSPPRSPPSQPLRPPHSPPQSPPSQSPPPPRRALSRGRSFTLEDALLPAISTASYTSHSHSPLRHPYAQ